VKQISHAQTQVARGAAALILASALLGGATRLPAQNAAKAPRLTLASSTGTPGGSLVIPVYLDNAGVALATLHLETTFVSRNLKLQKFTPGSAAEASDTKVAIGSSEEKDDAGLEHTTLRVEFEAADKSRPIPNGLVGYISLRVNEKAGPAIISFRSHAEATLASDSSQKTTIEIIDDQVEIIAEGSEPLISCFFFTH
jgi:hypothetical protein